MGNRKLPFGYKMVLGEVTIHSDEAMLVREIFKRYLSGESLKDLAEAMSEQSILYGEDRAWNKNMIARILDDHRYTGEKGFPKLIEQEQFHATTEKRAQKSKPSQKTEAQKILRRLCGESPTRMGRARGHGIIKPTDSESRLDPATTGTASQRNPYH